MEEETITLLSSDHEEFKISRAVAEESETIRCMLAETSMDCPVPVSKVQGKILKQVIEFCQYNVDAKAKLGEKGSKSVDEVRFIKAMACAQLEWSCSPSVAWHSFVACFHSSAAGLAFVLDSNKGTLPEFERVTCGITFDHARVCDAASWSVQALDAKQTRLVSEHHLQPLD